VARARMGRVGLALGAASLLIAGMFAGTAQAAQANWAMTITNESPNIASGGFAGFTVTIVNNGPSNIAQLFYVDSPSGAAANVTDPRCVLSPDFACTFGSLPAGGSITFTVAYGPITASTFAYRGEINANGATFSDKGKNSHGDSLFFPPLSDPALSSTICSTIHCGGGFQFNAGGNVSNSTNLQKNTNKQSTQIFGIAALKGAYVEDGPGVQAKYADVCANPNFHCGSAGAGEWSVIVYDNGKPQPAGSAFKIVITTLGSFSAANLSTPVDHATSDANGNVIALDTITLQCNLVGGQPVAASAPNACFYSELVTGNGNNVVAMKTTVWAYVNGPMRK
jgi:hypothetical protein